MIKKIQVMKKGWLRSRSDSFRIGFVPLVDCAPLIVAKEMGFFDKHGVSVVLQKEFGWAAVRDKLLMGELHAAHAAAGLSLAMTLGIGSLPLPMLTGLVLNTNGNSIVMNTALHHSLKEGSSSLSKAILSNPRKKVTLGVVSMTSSHYFLLGKWLARHRVDIQKDVQIVVLPPPQMAQNLAVGNIQGFCAGEPWGSVAVEEGFGSTVAVSSEIEPNHLEKVLLVSQAFESEFSDSHLKIRQALLEACAYCDEEKNRPGVAKMISDSKYVKCSSELILRSLRGPYRFDSKTSRIVEGFHCFSGDACNAPTEKKGAWLLEEFDRYGLLQGMVVNRSSLLRSVFREDLYRQSLNLGSSPSKEVKALSKQKISTPNSIGEVNYQWA